MKPAARLATAVGLLIAAAACTDPGCGGCVAPLEQPFPRPPRVYDAAKVKLQRSALDFVEQRLPQILDTLLADGLNFEVPTQTFDAIVTDIDVCRTPCPLQVTIEDLHLDTMSPDRIVANGHISVDGTITLDTKIVVDIHCDFPLQISGKPISATVALRVDQQSDLFYFDVTDLQVELAENDYDIDCPMIVDQALEALKPQLTSLLNSQLQGQLAQAIDDLERQQNCTPCDFYSAGCPAGSSCASDGYCDTAGGCLVKPQGLVGTLDLGEQMQGYTAERSAPSDLFVVLGQGQQPVSKPFVVGQGLELRLIGGAYAGQSPCIPEPDPSEIPPTGEAPAVNLPAQVPGTGEPYMLAVAVSDMYLDYLVYQLWRSGVLCLDLDSYHVSQLTSGALGLMIPSLSLLAEGENVPVRLEVRPGGVPFFEVGAGTFLPDGTMDEPLLSLFMPRLRMNFWMRLQGNWTRFLVLEQDVRIDLGLGFTADNQLVPILDGNSVTIENVQVSAHELLAEDPASLAEVIPQLIEIFLPMLTGQLGAISIGDLQGFVLQVKALRGYQQKPATPYYDYMVIFADIDFQPAAPLPVRSRPEGRLRTVRPAGYLPTAAPPAATSGEWPGAEAPDYGCSSTPAGGGASLLVLALLALARKYAG